MKPNGDLWNVCILYKYLFIYNTNYSRFLIGYLLNWLIVENCVREISTLNDFGKNRNADSVFFFFFYYSLSDI